MSDSTRASRGSSESEPRRWWRISEHAWYTQLMAALGLVATVLAVFFGVRQAWPDPEPSKPVKNNYAILLDRSESMGGALGDTTKLATAADDILDTIDVGGSEATARGLWYFGGGCGQVDENVDLAPDNASQVRTALEDLPPAVGERPLIQALDAVVNDFAHLPVTLGGGDVKTVRRIVVFTDGPDECGDDLSRVTTSLDQSGIQVEFQIVGIDLSPGDRLLLNEIAQSLPGVGGEPAKVTDVNSTTTTTSTTSTATTDPRTSRDPSTTTPPPSVSPPRPTLRPPSPPEASP